MAARPGDLGEVDLDATLGVAQPILLPRCIRFRQLLQLLDRSIPVHFQVDADAAVIGLCRQVEIQVGHAHLDNLGEHFSRSRVVRDTDLWLASESRQDAAGKPILERSRKVKRLVELVPMLVYEGNPRFLNAPITTATNYLVEEGVEPFVLGLLVFKSQLSCLAKPIHPREKALP